MCLNKQRHSVDGRYDISFDSSKPGKIRFGNIQIPRKSTLTQEETEQLSLVFEEAAMDSYLQLQRASKRIDFRSSTFHLGTGTRLSQLELHVKIREQDGNPFDEQEILRVRREILELEEN